MSTRPLVVLLLLAAAVPRLAPSQTVGSLTIVGGQSTDTRGVRANALTVAPGAIIGLGSRSSIWLGAVGTRFENDVWSGGASTALAARSRSTRGLSLTLNGNAGATYTSYDAHFLTGDAIGAAEFGWHAVSVYAGAHAIGGRTTIATGSPLPPFGAGASDVTITRASLEPVYGAQVRLVGVNPRSSMAAWVRDDPMWVEESSLHDRSLGLGLTTGRVTLSGVITSRRADDERLLFGNGSASVALNSSVSVDVSSGSYPVNPFTGAASGRYVSAGMSFRFGSGRRSLPVPTGVDRPDRGVTRLSILARDASRVEIAGDWNSWQPVAAKRSANGVWYADIHLAPGEYRYSFRIDGREWRVPKETVGVDDGFGGKAAYVRVIDGGAK